MRQRAEWLRTDFHDFVRIFEANSNNVQTADRPNVAAVAGKKRVAGTFECLSYRAKLLSTPSRACGGS